MVNSVERGGAEVQLLNLVKNQVKSGHKISVLTGKYDEAFLLEFRTLGVEVITEKNTWPCVKLSTLKRILSEIDLLHAHLPRAELVALFLNLLFSVKFIVTRHNTERMLTRYPKWLSRVVSRICTNRSSGVIAISNAVKNFLIETREVGSKVQIDVIYYGISLNIDRTGGVRKRSDNSPKDIVVVARLEPQKNLAFLLDVLQPNLLSGDFRLSIYGDGSLKNELQAKSKFLDISQNVFFRGKVDNVIEILEGSELFILPSLYEGFGMVFLEAMVADCKVVASDLPVTREIFGFSYPYLAKPNNLEDFRVKIRSCMQAPRESTNARFFEILDRFNEQKNCLAHQQFYERVSRVV